MEGRFVWIANIINDHPAAIIGGHIYDVRRKVVFAQLGGGEEQLGVGGQVMHDLEYGSAFSLRAGNAKAVFARHHGDTTQVVICPRQPKVQNAVRKHAHFHAGSGKAVGVANHVSLVADIPLRGPAPNVLHRQLGGTKCPDVGPARNGLQ